MSFKNYLTNYRIKEAAKQIINTDDKINRIAENVGYKDSDYFIRKFIEIMGCTPSKYRKTNRRDWIGQDAPKSRLKLCNMHKNRLGILFIDVENIAFVLSLSVV